MRDMAFAFFRFLGKDMAFESVFPFDVSGAGDPESLLGAGVGFHFWHRCVVIIIVISVQYRYTNAYK